MTDPRTLAHTPDPRALAHEAMRYGSLHCPEHRHCQLCDQITSALRTARKEALNEAAKVADEREARMDAQSAEAEATGRPRDLVKALQARAYEAKFITAAIRKLGDDNG